MVVFQSRLSTIPEPFISFKIGYNEIFIQRNITKKSISHFLVLDYPQILFYIDYILPKVKK